jgi:hypothetical protein
MIKIFFIILLLFPQNLFAQNFIKYADWGVFSTQYGKKKICYAISLPIKRKGDYQKRGEPYFIITDSGNNIDEITVSSGYEYKNNSEVNLSFGLKKFSIFTHKNLAWANSKSDDIDIVKEMRRNLDVIVIGTSKNDSFSHDTYSLIGFTKAYAIMKEMCSNQTQKLNNY